VTFQRYLQEQGLAKATVGTYARVARLMGDTDPAAWFKGILADRPTQSTATVYRAAARHMLVFQGMRPRDADDALPKARGSRGVTRQGLTDAQLVTFYAAAEEQPESVRTVLLLLPRTGLRVSEISGAQVAEIQRRGRSWFLALPAARAKGAKARDIPLNAAALDLFRSARKRFPDGTYLFPARSRGSKTRFSDVPINAATVRQACAAIRSEQSSLGRLTPHVLRHTFASRIANGGTSLRLIQELLGHESIKTTARYVHPQWSQLEQAVASLE
jgi:integrase